MSIVINNGGNNTILNTTYPNVLFFEIPGIAAAQNEEVLAYTIENWNEMVDENNISLYDFFIGSNQHWQNGASEGCKLKKLEIDNFIVYWYYSNGPDSWYQDVKIANDGKVYIRQRGWDSRTTEATGILAIRKTQNTIVTTNTENFATKVDIAIPTGLITMWCGDINNIPNGWVLCDGTNNTPDLRDRFIVGAGNTYNVGDTGGYNEITLTTEQMPSHQHSVTMAEYYYEAPFGNPPIIVEDSSSQGLNHTNHYTTEAGNNEAHENRPPYYALAYIMKT